MFYKSIQESGEAIEISIACYDNNYSDRMYIGINSGSTMSFDSEYDAYKLKGAEAAPQLYTVDSDGNELAVNTIPSVASNLNLPMNLEVGVTAKYQISLNVLNGFEGIPVFLEDLQTNTIINLKTNSGYKFSASPDDDPNRFLLHFGHAETPPFVAGNSSENLVVYSFEKTIVLNAKQPFSGKVEVYDMLGRKIISNVVNEITYQEYLVNKQTGYYIVKVINELTVVTEKVFIK
jgi:hypothetical protein